MKIRSIFLFLATLLVLSSCISNKVPNKEKKARKKLAKVLHLKDRLINTYPELVDCVIVLIPEHVIDTVYIDKVDTITVDSLLIEYVSIHKHLREAYIRLHKL